MGTLPHLNRSPGMRNPFRTRSVVITGASAGLGRAVADAFVRRRWRVALLARGGERLEAAEESYGPSGSIPASSDVRTFQVDVSDAGALAAIADQLASEWGGIDVWINNAMVTVFAPFWEIDAAEFRRVIEVTFLGQVNGTRAALEHMRARDAGTIMQMNSALGVRSIPLQSAYCAAKAAIRGFTDALRSELLHEGSRVRLTTVYLPAMNTPQFDWARSSLPRRLRPVPPVFQPEAIAEQVVKAALRAPREIWIGRSTMEAILGTAAAPAWLDRMMARKAWEGQMTDERVEGSQSGNLYEPAPERFGAHGRFDRSARYAVRTYSPIWVRAAFGGVAALSLAALGWGAWLTARRRPG
ncbi:MAG: SDR family oxidoreductase [Steroidobacteraceae bacterium]